MTLGFSFISDSAIGSANLDADDLSAAIEFFNKDQTLARSTDDTEAISRSLGNLGRVYARQGQFQKAIDVWEEKATYSFTPIEGAWLFHEVCNCD